jgi:hypothetical protein
MISDLLDRLPPAREIAREIYETAQRGRRLRSLYRVLRTIEEERENIPVESAMVCPKSKGAEQ